MASPMVSSMLLFLTLLLVFSHVEKAFGEQMHNRKLKETQDEVTVQKQSRIIYGGPQGKPYRPCKPYTRCKSAKPYRPCKPYTRCKSGPPQHPYSSKSTPGLGH